MTVKATEKCSSGVWNQSDFRWIGYVQN